MKYAFKLSTFFLVLICFSCSNNAEENREIQDKSRAVPTTMQTQETAKYQCPKKCEGDKTCEEPITCPVCNKGMEIIVEAKKK